MKYMPTPDVTRKVDLPRTGAATVWNMSPASLRIASSRRPAIVTSLQNYQLQTGLGDGNRAELCCLT
jgi:hypothetical protein